MADIKCSSCRYCILATTGRHEGHLHPPEYRESHTIPVEKWEFPLVDPDQISCSDFK